MLVFGVAILSKQIFLGYIVDFIKFTYMEKKDMKLLVSLNTILSLLFISSHNSKNIFLL